MNEVIEHVKAQLLNTKISQGGSAHAAEPLATIVMAYVNLMNLAVAVERQAMQLQMEAAERGFTSPPENPTPPSLVVAR